MYRSIRAVLRALGSKRYQRNVDDDDLMTCKNHNGRGCSLGLFGGKPSPGVCETCTRYQGRPRGLGDVIHAAAKATGLDRLAPKGCGCSKRRAALNDSVPFEKKRDPL